MAHFRKKASRKTQISTSSLPDIVFLLLFFFMVSATIKPNAELLAYKVPNAENLVKPEMKFLIKELVIGFPKSQKLGVTSRISDGKRYLEIKDIAQWATAAKAELPENYKDQMIVLLKADADVDMGLIADIQEQLREVDARKVLYRTSESTTDPIQ
ncbi:biopolymer transporter ExbD [Reichenbachiella sp. MALMAid0571]|uniref:ExbD/TolR family protein n=1 Tax=Reichenbachiella sp. MALMAid0571 TaxID=3143939 RepID=UPI0032DEDA23